MNTLRRKRIFGFTVIELMIVLVILAIIIALAYPSFVQYARKAKRGEAQQMLMNWAVNQEIWRSNNPSYNDVNTPGDAGYMVPDSDYYNFSFADVTATTYTLRAEAQGDQANDKSKAGDYCGGNGTLMTIDQNGVKSPAACWE
jgi:type IV pilus assembly protein PilE